MIERDPSLRAAAAPVFSASVHRAHELAPHVAILGAGLPGEMGAVPVLLQLLAIGRGDLLLYFPSPATFTDWMRTISEAYVRALIEWQKAEDRKTNRP